MLTKQGKQYRIALSGNFSTNDPFYKYKENAMAYSENFTPPEIQKQLALISSGKGGWNLELNLVSWNGRPAKFDIRSWSPDHQKMSKGITLTAQELQTLKDVLNSMELYD